MATNSFVQKCLAAVMVLSVALNAFFTYRNSLQYFFTDTDTLTLIDTSRVQSFEDIVRIFSEPVMNGTQFVTVMKYYRPISILSYSLDYAIWKLDPFGYHLTDLVLHILVSVLAFFVIRSLTGKQSIAWLATLLFINHPILMESVPAPARRHDVIAALFLLLALLLFVKHLAATSQRNKYLMASILAYGLALSAKELAIIFPPLVFAYLMLFVFSDEEVFSKRMGRAAKGSLPFFIATFFLLAWRVYILRGLGGPSDRSFGIWTGMQMFFDIMREYFLLLLYPINFLGLSFGPYPSPFERSGALAVLLLLVILVWVYRANLLEVATYGRSGALKLAKGVFIAGIILSLVGLLAYPLIAPGINALIHQAYFGKGPAFLTGAMEGRFQTPLEQYLHNTRYIIVTICADVLITAAVALLVVIGIQRRNKTVGGLSTSTASALFFLVWLMLPVCVFLTTLVFQHRFMYIPAIPFSALLAVIVVGSFESALKNSRTETARRGSYDRALIKGFGAGALSISLLAYSPLFRDYPEWKVSGELFEMFLKGLPSQIGVSSNNVTLQIEDLPEIEGIPMTEGNPIYVKSVGDISGYSIKSWLDMTYPGNKIRIIVAQPRARVIPKNLKLNLKNSSNDTSTVSVSFDKGNTLPYSGETALWSREPESFPGNREE